MVDNRGIPPLAGVCSYEAAARAGLGVEETVVRLKRVNYVLRRLHEVAAAHLPSTPEWEVKCALSLHLWLDAEHATLVRARVAEMREPPLHLDDVPDGQLAAVFDETIRAADTAELVGGAYLEVRAALVHALRDHLDALNPLFDYPTCRMLRTILREQEEILTWAGPAYTALVLDPETSGRAERFRHHVRTYLTAAGGVAGSDAPAVELPAPRSDGRPYEMALRPRRDDRFFDEFNATAEVDVYYRDESLPLDERTWALAFKRLREMDVPEWMAPIIFKTRGKPWAYYTELSRQLWDEARHAMMGEISLVSLGIPFYDYPIDTAGSATLNLEFTPLEAHILLWHVEQGLMSGETGKRFEWQLANAYGDRFFTTLQDYDWADEVLHAQIGRRWLKDEFPARKDLSSAGHELMERWEASLAACAERSPGREWWPEFVARARNGGRAAT
jgi:hypothetical protein